MDLLFGGWKAAVSVLMSTTSPPGSAADATSAPEGWMSSIGLVLDVGDCDEDDGRDLAELVGEGGAEAMLHRIGGTAGFL